MRNYTTALLQASIEHESLNLKPGDICFAWYPDQYNKLELFYCVIHTVGSHYCSGELFFDEKLTIRRGMVNDICTPDMEPLQQTGKGHQFKADSRRYKAFVQAIDELSAQLLIKKSGFEADIFNKLEAIRRDLQFEIDAIEDDYDSKD